MLRALPLLALLALWPGTCQAAQAGQSPTERFQYAATRSADGFDMPVGKPDADGYYRSRGLIVGRHMGDDWNGAGGGNTDLGAPVYATAHGLVVYAKDARMGWGKLVIVRHVFWEGGKWNYVDSVYAHLHQIFVREGQQIRRGQLVGSIGTNRGMYVAHLHFEIRKNLRVGVNQGSYRKDLNNYYKPFDFINARRKLDGGNRRVNVPINTFRLEARVVDTMGGKSSVTERPPRDAAPSATRKGDFRIFRFGD
ncbi:MAG: murein hydrolase activator EnvC family protein [Chthoniobacterales bacterium]|jgi:murein DD-endopeptidase MepM/ murein hydrolase activator NlpD